MAASDVAGGVRGLRVHYDVLGVARTATPDQMRAAYRTRARANHPDAGGDPAHGARNVNSQTDDARGFCARAGLELVERPHGVGTHIGDVAFHAEILEHPFELAGVLLQYFVADTFAAGRAPLLLKKLQRGRIVWRIVVLGVDAGMPLALLLRVLLKTRDAVIRALVFVFVLFIIIVVIIDEWCRTEGRLDAAMVDSDQTTRHPWRHACRGVSARSESDPVRPVVPFDWKQFAGGRNRTMFARRPGVRRVDTPRVLPVRSTDN